MAEAQKILFYDGECALCNFAVNYVIEHIHSEDLYFSPLSSQYAQNTIPTELKQIDSIIYMSGNQFYVRSDAMLQLLEDQNAKTLTRKLFKLFPRSVRDFIYDLIARNRKVFQKDNICPLLPIEYRNKILT